MSLIQMSSCLENTNHDPNDCNDPIPEVDFNDETYDDDDDDEDLYVEEERMLFIKSLKPVGNSFALVRKSNGDPTFLMYEGLSDGEDCVYDPDRRVTRSFTRKSRGSNSFSHSVSPSGLDKKRENDHNRGAGTNRVGLNFSSRSVCRPRRIRNRSVVKKVDGDGRLGEGDKMVRGLAKRQRNDRDSGADPRKVGSNCLPYYLRPRRKQKPSVSEKVSDDGLSGKIDRVVRGLAKKHSNDQDNGADTGEVSFNCLSQNVTRRSNRNRNVVKNVGGDCSDRVNKWRAKGSNVDTRRSRRGLANGDYSSKVDKWRARLSGSKYRSGLGKKRKNDNGDKIESSCIVEAQGGQDNGAEKEGNICIMGTQRDQGNCAEKELNCKIEPQDDQDYADSNRAYGIWLRNYMEKTCDFENNNVETSSDELEVLDKDPQCSEWKYTPVADSNMEDDDVQCIGELSKPENPQFRKDVEDILGRPYDEKEYETLWLQVNSRKPVQGYRELRGNLKAYSKDTVGKSYLDEYLDLRRKLDTFETDLPRKLNVLRGFFCYMKNIASDGIFKPWLDESCLAIVPGTK